MPSSTVEDYLEQILLEEQRAGGEARISTGRIVLQLEVTPGARAVGALSPGTGAGSARE